MPSPKLDLRGVCPGCGQTVDVTGARTWATHSAVADQSSTAKRYRRCAWSSQKLGAAEMRASLTAAHEGAVRAAATRLREAEAARDAHVAALALADRYARALLRFPAHAPTGSDPFNGNPL